jgi:predicted ArsR family transcriptional regulator
MEPNEISTHQIQVYRALLRAPGWLSNSEIAQQAGVAPRTARHHTHNLVALGVVDQAEVFPGHRFRVSQSAKARNHGYHRRIIQAAEVLGISLDEGDIK